MTKDDPLPSPAEVSALRARIDRPVVLVGMMGVGKSSVGRKLATLLDLPFADADDEIENAAQMSIPEIFDQFGEGYFRDGERRVIARMIESGPGILATGGGAFVQDETRELILDKAIALWLDADTDTLVERVGRKPGRPLLRNGDPREILTRLKAERRPFYEQAPLHVVSEAGPHQQTVLRIMKALDQWL
ncbi:shikimate kinase [Altericroceibacterium spongiae]|uniref:Shikimate kinase n=1 Tax=Altericroceibacterium spongiae TaxID=2320269 RepID=A0A420EF48_9SPHN|nr:shikimate kinase [Altericroceibacterium spongiae]RKF19325.1 shikimate kinase [Altericroceibacterium spongiae]